MRTKRVNDRICMPGIKVTICDTSALLSSKTPPRKGGNIVPITSAVKWALKHLFRNNCDIVHLDAGSNWKLRLYIGVVMGLIWRKKLVVSLNGNDLTWPYAINCLRKPDSSFRGKFITKLVTYSLKQASFIIVRNPAIEQLCLSLGFRAERLRVIPGFILPVLRDREFAEIPREIWDFIDNHSPVISANAFKIVFYNDQDLYGIDMCVDLCANLRSIYPQIGLVFCLPDIGDHEYFNRLRQRIAAKGIEDNFLFVTQPYQLYPILMKSQVFLRPTNTDGDATSLREALYFRVPSVASDVSPRPEGTILFKNRDIDDFTFKVKHLLGNYEQCKAELDSVKVEDNFKKHVDVYHELVDHSWRDTH